MEIAGGIEKKNTIQNIYLNKKHIYLSSNIVTKEMGIATLRPPVVPAKIIFSSKVASCSQRKTKRSHKTCQCLFHDTDNHDIISLKLYQLTVLRSEKEEKEEEEEEITLPSVDNMELLRRETASATCLPDTVTVSP